MKKLVFVLLSAIAVCMQSDAEVIHWNGPDGGDWWDSENWSPQKVPQSPGQTARFSSEFCGNQGAKIRITDPESITVDRIEVPEGGEWTFLLEGVLTFDPESPQSHSTNHNINVASSSKLTFVGGKVINASYRLSSATKGGGSNCVVFSNTVNEAAMMHKRNGSDEGAPDAFTINGGMHRFRTWYPRHYDRITVNSGLVMFGSIHGYDRYGEGFDIRRDDALLVNGGKVVIDGVDREITSSSVGVLAANDSVVDIRSSGNELWIANFQNNAQGRTCTWKVQDRALFKAAGPYVVANQSVTANVEVVGGRFVMTSTFQNTGGDSSSVAGRCSAFLVDGGTLDLDYASDGRLHGTLVTGSYSHRLVAGPSGARVRNRNAVQVTVTAQGFVSSEDGDGGVIYEGKGRFNVGAGSYSGGTVIRGLVLATSASGAFGTGAVALKDGGVLRTETASSVLPPVSFTNAATIHLNSESANVTVPSLTGAEHSVLMLSSYASRSAFGTTDARYVQSGTKPALDALGLPVLPVVAITRESNNSANELHLLTIDEDTGKFKVPDYVAGLDGGSDKIAFIEDNIAVSEDKHVGALVLKGAYVSGGGKLTIGNDKGNAYLVFDADSNGSGTQITGGKNVYFGAARGYVLSGAAVGNNSTGGSINGYINGSGGVVFCSQYNGGIALYRKQKYTGDTRVLGGVVLMTDTGSYKGDFGAGKVYVTGGEYTGGSVRFQNDGETYSQDYEISGFGSATSDKTGAIDFCRNATMSGNVRIANDAMIAALSRYAGTISRTVTGTGDLYLGSPARTGAIVLFGGIDIDGDLHVDTCVTNSGPIDLDGRFIYLDGTLVFNNTEDITVNAKVIGEGKIVLAGSGKVDFADVSVFDGVIDVEGNSAAEIGALYGIASVTNSASSDASLTVAGTSDFAFFGTFYPGVDLGVSGGMLLGITAEIPETASLRLDGGDLTLFGPTGFASLYGKGTVYGDTLSVSGDVVPSAEKHEDAIVFEYAPLLANGVPDGWSMHSCAEGVALRRTYGTTLVIR